MKYPIEGFSKYYMDEQGRIFHAKLERLVRPIAMKDKYLCVFLYDDNNKKRTRYLKKLQREILGPQ